MKYLISITFILLFTFSISAQTVDDELKECTQLFNKSMAETSACEKVVEAKDEVIASMAKRLAEAEAQLIREREASKDALAKKDEQIQELIKIKCNVTEIKFIFIIRKKRCYQ